MHQYGFMSGYETQPSTSSHASPAAASLLHAQQQLVMAAQPTSSPTSMPSTQQMLYHHSSRTVPSATTGLASNIMLSTNAFPSMSLSLPSSTSNLALAMAHHSNIYIAGIPHTWSKVHLDEYFGVFGTVLESRILVDKNTHGNRGIAFVRYIDIESAKRAIITCNGTVAPDGMERLVVRLATDKNTLAQFGLSPMSPYTLDASTAVAPMHQASLMNASLVGLGGNAQSPTSNLYLTSPQSSHLTSPTSSLGLPSSSISYSSTPSPLQLRDGHSPHHTHLSDFPLPPAALPPRPDIAKPQPPRQHGYHGRGRQRDPGAQLFVFHLPPHLTNVRYTHRDGREVRGRADARLLICCFFFLPALFQEDIIPLFSHFGLVLNCAVMRDPITNQSKGFAFITMATLHDAQQAINGLNGYQIGNKYLKVDHKVLKPPQPGRARQQTERGASAAALASVSSSGSPIWPGASSYPDSPSQPSQQMKYNFPSGSPVQQPTSRDSMDATATLQAMVQQLQLLQQMSMNTPPQQATPSPKPSANASLVQQASAAASAHLPPSSHSNSHSFAPGSPSYHGSSSASSTPSLSGMSSATNNSPSIGGGGSGSLSPHGAYHLPQAALAAQAQNGMGR
jgi:RNA recognition motif-containing protein